MTESIVKGTGYIETTVLGRGMCAGFFLIDDLTFYSPKKPKRIHPKRNRQRNPNNKRVSHNRGKTKLKQ